MAMITIGVDEAGRGPVIGPLVVCSVALPNKDLRLLVDNRPCVDFMF